MEFKNILIIAVVIIVLYLLYLWLFKDNTNYAIVQTTLKGSNSETIKATTLPNGGTSLNYSYTFWIYINDYNYNYGDTKVILDRHESTQTATNHHTPLIYLGERQNNLHVHITKSDTTTESANNNIKKKDGPKLEDLPLQKWCFVAVTLDNKVLDIYLDGKLVTSHYYDDVRKAPKNTDSIDINTSNAFDIKGEIAGKNDSSKPQGWGGIISNVEYFDRSLNAREIYERYRSGFTGAGGLLGGLGEDISKFNMKVSFLQDDVEVSQFKI